MDAGQVREHVDALTVAGVRFWVGGGWVLAGTLTIGTNNTWFTNLVTVEAPGTLRVGNGANGPPSVGSFVTNGNLVFDAGPVLTSVTGTVTGTGTR